MHATPRLDESSETFARLLDMAHGRTGPIPPEVLARHILSVTVGADWAVRRAAMAALLRRLRNSLGDKLVDDTGGGYLGLRRTRRKGRRHGERPYVTILRAIDPPVGSCNCPDYLKNSLGLCKHLIATISFIYDKPGRLERARAEQRRCVPPSGRLLWHPIRPLTGTGDWLSQVRLVTVGGERWAVPLLEYFDTIAIRGRAPGAWCLERPDKRAALTELLAETLESEAYRRTDSDPDPALLELLGADVRRPRKPSEGDAVDEALSSLKLRLYPYQIEAVRTFLGSERLLLADDMGLGKTAQSVAIAHVLHRAGRVRRGLVIVPASLKGQWVREWRRFTDTPVRMVDGRIEERRAVYRQAADEFLVVNYELVLRDLEALLAIEPQLVILDEAQRIKNWETKTAQAIKRLQPAFRLVLTGTPMQNRLDELASVMEWVDERALEPRWRLIPWHTDRTGDGGRGMVAARNLDALRACLARSLLRRRRSEVLGQLPERTDTEVPVEMSARQEQEHDLLEAPIRRLLAMAQGRPLTHEEFLRLMSLLTKQRMISNALGIVDFDEVWSIVQGRPPTRALLDVLASSKLIELRNLVQSVVLDQGRKVIIFSEWRRMLRLASWVVGDLLAGDKLRAVFFTGAESRKVRDRSVVEFIDDPATRIMFLSDAGGVGLNLQHAASCCINLELPWNPAVLEQRVARIYRLGQTEQVDVYNFVTTTGIEQRIQRLLAGKRALFDAVFDGVSDEVSFGEHNTFLERLEREYVPPISSGDSEDDDDDVLDGGFPMASNDEFVEPERSVEPTVTSNAPSTSPLEKVRIERTPDGGLRIDAPAEAAGELARAFDVLGSLFRSISAP